MRPILFLHIPKTAGTSFLLLLRNLFGDNRLRRIGTVDDDTPRVLKGLVDRELHDISCLAGHLPFCFLEPHLDRFEPYTLLRNPVARVLSLFRFLKQQSAAEIRRLRLRPDFSLDDMLDSKTPEVYGQVNNAMLRLLSSDRAIYNPRYPAFWRADGNAAALDNAQSNLARLGLGFVEDMGATLDMAQRLWSVPFALHEYRKNTTMSVRPPEEMAYIDRITSMNRMDFAIYKTAQEIFRGRQAQFAGVPAADAANPNAVFHPVPGRQYSIGEIAGRQGFHEYEQASRLAWLTDENAAAIHARIEHRGAVRLELQVHCIVPDYPAAEIGMIVNQNIVGHRFSPVTNQRGWLRSEPFTPREGLNRIEITMPWCVPVRELSPDSGDTRRLGIALANVMLTATNSGADKH